MEALDHEAYHEYTQHLARLIRHGASEIGVFMFHEDADRIADFIYAKGFKL